MTGRARGEAAASPPAPSIATSLLLPQSRIARAPLAEWAEGLVERADEHRRTERRTRKLCGELGGVANNAGLIAAHHGDAAVARDLCERQMGFQRRFARRAGDPAIVAHAIQPWVNLGRLEAILGEWESSVSRFARLRGFRQAGRVDLGSVCVQGWEALSPTLLSFEALLENIYATDTLKALLLNRRFEETLEMLAVLERDCPADSVPLAREAEVVARGWLGEHDRAYGLAADAARESRGWKRAVFRLRQAEVLASAGRRGEAAEVLLSLARVVEQVSPATRAELGTLHVMHRMGGLCAELGLEDEAVALARGCLEGARAANDEAFQIEALRVLASQAPAVERAGWEDELSRAEAATDYRRYRRSTAARPHPVLDPFYDYVREMLRG
jgi:hypothetical protein